MRTDIKKFKKYLSETMIQVFEKNGGTSSMLFFLYKDDRLMIKYIPEIIMSDIEAKNFIAVLIREKCKDPNMKAVAMITGVNIRNDQNEKTADGLMLNISIPGGDDITIYEVDCENEKVLGIHYEEFSTENRGRFSGFFQNDNN